MHRALVVDDERLVADLIGEAFRDDGYETDIVYGGRQAVRLFAERHHAVVVTDLLMPDFDGLEVIRAIRLLDLKSKVFAISGGGKIDSAVILTAACRFGADDAFEKPFLPTELVERASNLLQLHH